MLLRNGICIHAVAVTSILWNILIAILMSEIDNRVQLLVGAYSHGAGASYLRTAKHPIVLKLSPVNSLNTTSTKSLRSVRTKELFFQETLGVLPGSNFTFNVDRWVSIQQSGLFKNLTARTLLGDDGVFLEISGQELPSITFTPEISVDGIQKGPELSGGVC